MTDKPERGIEKGRFSEPARQTSSHPETAILIYGMWVVDGAGIISGSNNGIYSIYWLNTLKQS